VNPSDLRDERPEAVGSPGGDAAGPRPDGPQAGPGPAVARRQVQIQNAYGLHMRPANMFVKVACDFRETDIRVYYKDREVNGKSILDLVTLAAECGTRLELEARGPEAEAAVTALAELVASRFCETSEGHYKETGP
jgi:phosphocarrier protein HPr